VLGASGIETATCFGSLSAAIITKPAIRRVATVVHATPATVLS
jgi:hypothetical protein